MVSLTRTSADHPDFHLLVELLDQDLWIRYPETQGSYVAFNIIKWDAQVIIAYMEDLPVGCGCFREAADPNTVEIKRMFVKEEARGKGIANRIISELEAWAVESGKERAILETGNNQPEAVGLYEKLGYERIAKYEPYVDNEASICMGKMLAGKLLS